MRTFIFSVVFAVCSVAQAKPRAFILEYAAEAKHFLIIFDGEWIAKQRGDTSQKDPNSTEEVDEGLDRFCEAVAEGNPPSLLGAWTVGIVDSHSQQLTPGAYYMLSPQESEAVMEDSLPKDSTVPDKFAFGSFAIPPGPVLITKGIVSLDRVTADEMQGRASYFTPWPPKEYGGPWSYVADFTAKVCRLSAEQ